MIREELKKLKTGPGDLRKFGLVVGGVFSLIALFFWWRGGHYALFLVPAVPLIVLGLAWPKCLRSVYLGWMGLALILGLIVSTILLTILYYLVLTPMGMAARLCGKDFMDRRWQREQKSYWKLRDQTSPRQRQRYEQQF
jgi:hypothetical protein